MPRFSKLARSKSVHDSSIAPLSIFDFLAPAVFESRCHAQQNPHQAGVGRRRLSANSSSCVEGLFYTAISQASTCRIHQRRGISRHISYVPLARRSNHSPKNKSQAIQQHDELFGVRDGTKHDPEYSDIGLQGKNKAGDEPFYSKTTLYTPLNHIDKETRTPNLSGNADQNGYLSENRNEQIDCGELVFDAIRNLFEAQNHRKLGGKVQGSQLKHTSLPDRSKLEGHPLVLDNLTNRGMSNRSPSPRGNNDKQPHVANGAYNSTIKGGLLSSTRKTWPKLVFGGTPEIGRDYSSCAPDFESEQRRFAEGSYLPGEFFDDVSVLKGLLPDRQNDNQDSAKVKTGNHSSLNPSETSISKPPPVKVMVGEQMELIKTVRELEGKLQKAKTELAKSMAEMRDQHTQIINQAVKARRPLVLTKEDYMNLVDLYFHSHNSRFSPESTDGSPTPLVLNDYTFQLSADFSPGGQQDSFVNEDESYESPLKRIEELLKQRQLREVVVMQVFVDLLLDDHSSNRALYEAYRQLPEPGVAYLPPGIVRLFLQRMSTPWTTSEKSMLRYLYLIDDMQKAQIPITVAEWSSAVYLAGRAFSRVTDQEVKTSFQLWQTMERDAGVRASHVTFNILFDIAVRSGKFALAETVMKEMHSRDLRLNRLGRVSLMYYHGLRGDGDGVRKAYRDFVEAGEIVDTLVLNCVVASLLNAQEPQAAEQVYARMKTMQSRLREGINPDSGDPLYERYPDPGGTTIEEEVASNHLGRILEKAPRLLQILPDHHKDLQASMPLTPDHTTFRSMIAYHATTSGDLDRLTVLLQDMTDFFELPLQTITFQLLFKGFAIHGPIGGPNSVWSVKRLDLCWKACRTAIKQSENARYWTQSMQLAKVSSVSEVDEEWDRPAGDYVLPSIPQLSRIPEDAPLPDFDLPLSRPPPRRLSDWSEFVLDLAAFPRERLKRLERFHATMFDAEGMTQPHEKPGVHTFQSPFFQSVAYTAPEPHLDTEEGEYELPNPSDPGLLLGKRVESGGESHQDVPVATSSSTGSKNMKHTPHQVAATRTLVCWLLRAYARCTKSRAKVEEIWGQMRKIYRSRDATERESVVRVLRRCLRDCDREGNG